MRGERTGNKQRTQQSPLDPLKECFSMESRQARSHSSSKTPRPAQVQARWRIYIYGERKRIYKQFGNWALRPAAGRSCQRSWPVAADRPAAPAMPLGAHTLQLSGPWALQDTVNCSRPAGPRAPIPVIFIDFLTPKLPSWTSKNHENLMKNMRINR